MFKHTEKASNLIHIINDIYGVCGKVCAYQTDEEIKAKMAEQLRALYPKLKKAAEEFDYAWHKYKNNGYTSQDYSLDLAHHVSNIKSGVHTAMCRFDEENLSGFDYKCSYVHKYIEEHIWLSEKYYDEYHELVESYMDTVGSGVKSKILKGIITILIVGGLLRNAKDVFNAVKDNAVEDFMWAQETVSRLIDRSGDEETSMINSFPLDLNDLIGEIEPEEVVVRQR